MLTSKDISPNLKGRHAELFWPADGNWYLIEIQVWGCEKLVHHRDPDVGLYIFWYLIEIQVGSEKNCSLRDPGAVLYEIDASKRSKCGVVKSCCLVEIWVQCCGYVDLEQGAGVLVCWMCALAPPCIDV
eukprot:1160774-Pelagomonas_calceolata.AAC.5